MNERWTKEDDALLIAGEVVELRRRGRTSKSMTNRRANLRRAGLVLGTTTADAFDTAQVGQAFNAWRAPAPAQLMGVV